MTTQFRRLRRPLGALGVLAVLAVAVYQLGHGDGTVGAEAARQHETPAADRPVAVTATPIDRREVQRSVGAVGTFYGFDELTVSAEVSGRVVQVFHETGDVVQPGDALLQIDPTDYELTVEEKRREIELDATRIGLRDYVPADKDFNPDNVLKLI
ncbi:MAG: biotin/lipoyl-binding protein, partial [Thermoguttaceae bacterium]